MPEHGRYTALTKVADGGMAEIFLAQQHGRAGFRRLVVLKRILPALMADETIRHTLLDEAHIAMRLHHNNVAEVLDVGESNGTLFLVLELVDGWSLHEVVRRAGKANKSLPLELALFLVGETCRGLAYAHSREENGEPLCIVHRDISPQNVLLSVEGEVKVTDFGIARASTRSDRTAAGMVKGKPRWMSPEQARGGDLDARSDVFSLGTMLYALSTGQHPFKANTDLETMLRVQQAKFLPPSKVAPDLPRAVVRIITKAMKKDPDDRFDTAEEMLAAVEKALRSSARPAGQTELKQWLAELSKKDGQKALSERVAQTQPPRPNEPEEWIELSEIHVTPHPSEVVTLNAPNPHNAPTRRVLPRPGPKKRRSVWLRLGLLAVLLGALAAAVVVEGPEKVLRALGVDPALVLGRDAGVDGTTPSPSPDMPSTSSASEWAAFPRPADGGAASAATTPEAVPDASLADAAAGPAGQLSDAGAAERPGAGQPTPDAGAAAVPPAATSPRAAAPEAPPEFISIQVLSTPPGASVTVGGRKLATTPTRLRFSVGVTFEAVFAKDGYAPTTKRFTVSGKPTQVVRAVLKQAK